MSPPTLASVIRSDPEILGGTPVFAGTRVPVKNLVDYLTAGGTLERFPDHFPSVTRAQAVAALEIAGDRLASRAHPARAREPRRAPLRPATASRASAHFRISLGYTHTADRNLFRRGS
jgi:uncharacterized protein (DUF433 family)